MAVLVLMPMSMRVMGWASVMAASLTVTTLRLFR